MKNDENDHDIAFLSIKKGDRDVFKNFFNNQYTPMVNYAYKITRSEAAAEEIVQEMYLYIWEKKEKIELKTSLQSYMYAGIKNRCINYLKNDLPKSAQSNDIESVKEQFYEMQIGKEDESNLGRIVNDAIQQLPPKCKEIFLMSRYGGLTYDEISEELGISVKTVENQISIALKKLRELLKPLLSNR